MIQLLIIPIALQHYFEQSKFQHSCSKTIFKIRNFLKYAIFTVPEFIWRKSTLRDDPRPAATQPVGASRRASVTDEERRAEDEHHPRRHVRHVLDAISGKNSEQEG